MRLRFKCELVIAIAEPMRNLAANALRKNSYTLECSLTTPTGVYVFDREPRVKYKCNDSNIDTQIRFR